jgi:hypothetical protein
MSIDKHINYQNTCKKMYKWGPHSVTLSNNKSHKNLDLEWKNGPEKEIKSGNGVQNCEENTDTETSCHNEKSRQTRRLGLANMFPKCRLTHSLPHSPAHSLTPHSIAHSFSHSLRPIGFLNPWTLISHSLTPSTNKLRSGEDKL